MDKQEGSISTPYMLASTHHAGTTKVIRCQCLLHS
jgi:hypothetical protein